MERNVNYNLSLSNIMGNTTTIAISFPFNYNFYIS